MAASQYTSQGIRINCIAPGFVDTPQAPGSAQSTEAIESAGRHYPMGRIGRHEKIANKAVADYGIGQIVQWSPNDVAVQWQLSAGEIGVLKGHLKMKLDQLPIPVEPSDMPGQQERQAAVITTAPS